MVGLYFADTKVNNVASQQRYTLARTFNWQNASVAKVVWCMGRTTLDDDSCGIAAIIMTQTLNRMALQDATLPCTCRCGTPENAPRSLGSASRRPLPNFPNPPCTHCRITVCLPTSQYVMCLVYAAVARLVGSLLTGSYCRCL